MREMSRSALVLCLLVAACSAAPPTRLRRLRPVMRGRIVGGEPVDISQFPWQISLQEYDMHYCGGSIIGSTWVLTAGHCIARTAPEVLSVRAGTSTRESGGTVYSVASIIQHEDFVYDTKDYDFALLEITETISFGSNVQAVSLGTSEIAGGTKVSITGWGDTGDIYLSDQLQAVTTSIVDRDTCNAAYGGDITQRMICAGEADKDSCQGDSGGPLVAGSTQYGVVSWGRGCGLPGYPGIYSNVPAVRSWITEKTGI